MGQAGGWVGLLGSHYGSTVGVCCRVIFTSQYILGPGYQMTVVSPSLGDRQTHIVLCPQGAVSFLAEILFHLKSKKDTLHLMQFMVQVV